MSDLNSAVQVPVDPTPEVTEGLKAPAIDAIVARMSNNLELKTQAYSLFLTTNQSPEEIGLTLSVPGFLVRHWIGSERWADLKARVQLQVFKRAELEYQELVSTHRVSTAQRHLVAAKRLEDEVNYVLERMENAREERPAEDPLPRGHDMTLVRLSQALKNATDISARVVGISDKPPLTEAEASKTIILIGGRPEQAKKEKMANVIDIKEISNESKEN